MKKNEFIMWATNSGLALKSARDCASRVKAIEKEFNINLDEEWKKDNCASVIRHFPDKRNPNAKTTKFNILPNEGYRIGNVKYSLNKYLSFLKENNN